MASLCVICSDLFDDVKSCATIVCGHVFHYDCLMKWIDQSKTCPECRQPVTRKTAIKLFYNKVGSSSNDISTASLENQVESLKAELRSRDITLEQMKTSYNELKKYTTQSEAQVLELNQRNMELDSKLVFNKLELQRLQKNEKNMKHVENENRELKQTIASMENIRQVVIGSQKFVDDLLSGPNPSSAKDLACMCSCLKRELERVIEEKNAVRKDLGAVTHKLGVVNLRLQNANQKIERLSDTVAMYSADLNKSIIMAPMSSPSPSSTSTAQVCLPGSSSSSNVTPIPNKLPPTITLDDDPMTPISVNLSSHKKTRMQVSIPSENEILRKHLSPADCGANLRYVVQEYRQRPEATTSISRTGYNGLGGHTRTIFPSKTIKPGLKAFTATKKKLKNLN